MLPGESPITTYLVARLSARRADPVWPELPPAVGKWGGSHLRVYALGCLISPGAQRVLVAGVLYSGWLLNEDHAAFAIRPGAVLAHDLPAATPPSRTPILLVSARSGTDTRRSIGPDLAENKRSPPIQPTNASREGHELDNQGRAVKRQWCDLPYLAVPASPQWRGCLLLHIVV